MSVGENSAAFRVERRDDGVAVLWFDLPEESVNVLRPELGGPLEHALRELTDDDRVVGVVLASGKEDSFVVGADVHLLHGVESVDEGRRLAVRGQEMMQVLDSLSRPLVAAIHGNCLGGGLEIALACDARVASSADVTRLGQPEVQLGLIPGAGGTQRLPRLIGLEEALQLILTGRRIPPSRARELGLVDEVVHPAVLVEVAAQRVRALAAGEVESSKASADLKSLLLERNPMGRRVLFSQSEKRVRDQTGERMPAPLRAIEVMRVGCEEGLAAGLQAEAQAFGDLVVSAESRSLVSLFLARQELQKETGLEGTDSIGVEPRPIRKVAVLGAGLMGGGIAQVTAQQAELPVRLKDIDAAPLRSALRSVARSLDRSVKRGRMAANERDRILARIHPTTDYSGFARADVIVEAVVEDLEIKHSVLGEVEERAGRGKIFASNTSSLPIDRIAEASSRPETVVGMHYFSPVDRVPLLEVVVGRRTAPDVVATCVELGKRQGKTVIVVGDGPGFYTTRILGPYLNEAAFLVAEGVSIERIDGALEDFGFPVGPLQLLDEVGIDVGAKIAAVLSDAFGDRMRPVEVMEELVADDRKGRKNGRGLYRYEKKGSGYERGDVDESVYRVLDVRPSGSGPSREAIAHRCTLAMVNEALRCLEEGIVRSARDADVGAVFGLGFPPHLGGPARWLDQRGAQATLEEIETLAESFPQRFEPAPLLVELAREGRTLHD